VLKSETELKSGLPFMIPDFVYKFQTHCLSEAKVFEQKPNVGCTYM